MRKSIKVHAGLQLSLATVALCAGAYTAVPRLPPFAHLGVLLGIGFAVLFPLHVATIIRGIRSGAGKAEQWLALRALPRSLHVLLAGLGLAVAALLAVPDDDSGLQATDSARGRYYAVDTTDPRRSRIEVTRSEYQELSKKDQRTMFTIYAALAAGGGGLTLVFGKLDTWAGRP